MTDLSAEALKLATYGENERGIYFGYIVPTLVNLAKHEKRGHYSVDLAINSWLRVANAIAKHYTREHGSWTGPKWFRLYHMKVRAELAEHLEAYYRNEVRERAAQ